MSEKPQPFIWRGRTVGSTTSGGVTGPEQSHIERVEVGDEVIHRTEGVGAGSFGVVRSKSRDVRQHYRELARVRRAVAYRQSPVKSLLPDEPEPPQPAPDAPLDEIGRPMVACPECLGGGVTFCDLCDRTGWVTVGQAESWRDEHEQA